MAFYNTGARYLFALAREGVLPRALGRTHAKRHGPVVAAMVVSAIVGVYMLGFTIMDSSTEAALLKLGTWTPLLGVLGILAVQGLCSVAIIRFFLTEARDGFHSVQDADRADHRHAGDGRRLLPADRQPRRAVRARATRCSSRPYRGSCSSSSRRAWCWRLVLRRRSRETYAKIGRFSREEIPA